MGHKIFFINANQKFAKSKLPNFVSRDKIVSTSSKNCEFDCELPNGTTYVNCNSPTVIYLIT